MKNVFSAQMDTKILLLISMKFFLYINIYARNYSRKFSFVFRKVANPAQRLASPGTHAKLAQRTHTTR